MEREYLDMFIEEVKEYLEDLYENFLKIEEDNTEETQDEIFRILHTLKGMAGMMEFEKFRVLMHAMEECLTKLKKLNKPIKSSCIKCLFSLHKCLEENLANIIEDGCEKECLCEDVKNIVCKDIFDTLIQNYAGEDKDQLILINNEDDSLINENEFNVTVELIHEESMIKSKVFLILFHTKDVGEIIKSIPSMKECEDESFLYTDKEFSFSIKTSLTSEELYNEIDCISGILNITIKSNEKDNKSDIKENKKGDKLKETKNHIEEFLRIPESKIDSLSNKVSELMIIETLVEQELTKEFSKNRKLGTNIYRMVRLTKDLQMLSMSLRMISLKSTFNKLKKVARDTIKELDKKVEVNIEGADTEIDRSIAENIYTPLMHMVRNSIYHGIESEDIREKRDKSIIGCVKVNAYDKKGNVYIEISDDGNGLNIEKIYNKALANGIIDKDEKYSDEEILELIFVSGFSTADNINNISGRGVGMDVVKKEISKVGGSIKIDNIPQKGCKFTIKIPINLSILNGTIIKIEDDEYIIPTLNIKEIVNLDNAEHIKVKGKSKMIKVRDNVIPIINMYEILDKNDDEILDVRLMLVLDVDGKCAALPVSNVVGRREVVVKTLNENYTTKEYVSGASILGNGKVTLILDVDSILKKHINVKRGQ